MRNFRLAIHVFFMMLLAGCATQERGVSHQQALVEDLVFQVRLALSSVAARYNQTPTEDLPLSLNLVKADVKVSTALQVVDENNVKLVVSAGGTKTDKNENYVLLTLNAPEDSTKAFSELSSNSVNNLGTSSERDAIQSVLDMATYDVLRTKSDLKCGQNGENWIGDTDSDFWEDLAALTKAAADGYICAANRSDVLQVGLKTLEVNVAFTATKAGEAGFKLEIWKIELGKTGKLEATTGNSITMVFCESNSCEKSDEEKKEEGGEKPKADNEEREPGTT